MGGGEGRRAKGERDDIESILEINLVTNSKGFALIFHKKLLEIT
jgi:hypothetical protein